MTRCGAVVDQGVVLLCFQEVGNIGRADFEFEGGSDAVEGFDALAPEVLAMLVEIDEAGCDDETFYGDCSLSWERVGGDPGNFAVEDGDIADGVEIGFGVHDAAAFEDQVVLLGGGEGGEEEEGAG